jgi:hypothetical protein
LCLLAERAHFVRKLKCAGNATGKAQSLKDKMLEEQLRIAEETLADEANRSRAGFNFGLTPDPGPDQPAKTDLGSIKKKFSFLAEYTDELISKNGLDTIIKLESTALRLKEAEKGRATEEKLALNRDELAATIKALSTTGGTRSTQTGPPGSSLLSCPALAVSKRVHGQQPTDPCLIL